MTCDKCEGEGMLYEHDSPTVGMCRSWPCPDCQKKRTDEKERLESLTRLRHDLLIATETEMKLDMRPDSSNSSRVSISKKVWNTWFCAVSIYRE